MLETGKIIGVMVEAFSLGPTVRNTMVTGRKIAGRLLPVFPLGITITQILSPQAWSWHTFPC